MIYPSIIPRGRDCVLDSGRDARMTIDRFKRRLEEASFRVRVALTRRV